MKTARTLSCLFISMALASCGIAQRMQAREQAKQLAAQSDAAIADCNAKIPAPTPKTIVAKVKCLNDATAILMPTFGTDQDLALAFMADRLMVAEKIENGKMTMVEGNAAVAEKWSQAVSESQRRRTATASVAAQQEAAAAQGSAASAAWAAMNRPVTCMRTGNMTTCN